MFRKLNLSTVLVAFNVIVISVAIALVGLASGSLMWRLTDERAMARVELAGHGALQAIGRSADRQRAAARLLAGRPTLAQLVMEHQPSKLAQYLESYRQSSGLTACAVMLNGERIADAGSDLEWEVLWAERAASGDHFLCRVSGSGSLILGAWAAVPGVSSAVTGVALFLDEAYARETSDKVGLPVTVLEREQVEAEASPRSPVRLQALSGDGVVSATIDQEGIYVSAVPLDDGAGRTVGIVEAMLPVSATQASLRRLVVKLVLLTLVIGICAAVLSWSLGRRIARPLAMLTAAAARIGRGDLSSPIAHAPGAEAGTLAATMETMREQILRLTGELRNKRDEAEAILSGIVEGVYAVDRERRIRYLNPQAGAILGIETEDAVGRFCGDVLRPRYRGGVPPCEDSCPILHARFRGGARATERLLLPSGETRVVVITSAASSSAASDPHGETQQFQVIRDETEVEATRRLRDTVLANISHEFRSPLSAQLASIELLRDRLPELTHEELQTLLLSLERGTLRLTRLIDNLLESIRIEAGEISLRRQPIMLDAVVEEAVELMVPLIEQRQQRLELNLPYPLPAIQGDATRLSQVLVNLLANANKFAPGGTTITVGGAVTDSAVRLWVEDQGPGLPPATEGALFERFARSPGDEPEESGMGLGLWIVKSIVERHGGCLEADSKPNGTRVCIVLPLEGGHEDTGG